MNAPQDPLWPEDSWETWLARLKAEGRLPERLDLRNAFDRERLAEAAGSWWRKTRQ